MRHSLALCRQLLPLSRLAADTACQPRSSDSSGRTGRTTDIASRHAHLRQAPAGRRRISIAYHRKEVGSRAPTGSLPQRVDDLQEEFSEGPCLGAVYEQQTVRINDLRTATRWPAFVARAADAGALSMLAFQLYVAKGGVWGR